jgi:hypothetical protein
MNTAINAIVSSESNAAQRKQHAENPIGVFPLAGATAQRKQRSIVQWVLDKFDSDPTAALTTADIAMEYYDLDYEEIEKKHRVAVIRAIKTAVPRRTGLRTFNGDGPLGQIVVFNSHHVDSYAIARYKSCSWLYDYQAPTIYRSLEKCPSEEELRQKWQGETLQCRTWWKEHVEHYRALDCGDRLTCLKFERKSAQRLVDMTASLGGDGQEARQHLEEIEREIAELEASA